MKPRALSRLFILLAVAAQLLVLGWMAAEREWILRTGEVIYLRTAPIDPRDLFRGDFVRLHYEINSVRAEGRDPKSAASFPSARHEVMYTRLQPAGEGLFEAAGTSSIRPTGGVFIRGRSEDSWRFGARAASLSVVKYGIEQLYIEQGSGKAIEDRRGRRNGLQVPMEVEVAIDGSGTAVIRGYRWSRLGMKLEMLRQPERRNRDAVPPAGPLSPKVRVTLANVSEAPLAIVDPADHCAFYLVPVQWLPLQPVATNSSTCHAVKVTAADVITLAAGETHSVNLDLSAPRWHVLKDGQPVEIGALPGFEQFRIEYRASAAEALQATGIWRGRMASQAFNANGVID